MQNILSEPATTVSWVPTAVPAGLSLLRSLALFVLSAAGCTVAALGLGLLCYLLLSRALTPAQHIHTRTLYLDYSHADLLAQAAFLPGGEPAHGIIPPNVPLSTRCERKGRQGGREARREVLTADDCGLARRERSCCSFTYCQAALQCLIDEQFLCGGYVAVPHKAKHACCVCRFLPPGQRVDVWLELQMPDSSPSNCRGGMAQVVAELTTLDGRTAARTSRPLLLRSRGWDLW